MSSKIPIANIYHLLCYAWDTLPTGGLIDISADKADVPIDLLSSVLVNGTRHLLRRGIEQDYQEYSEELSAIRGKCLFSQSARRMLLQQGRALCEFDDLSPDTVQNKILKAALRRVASTWGIEKGIRKDAANLVMQFRDVSDIKLSAPIFKTVKLHGNNRFYRFLLNVCELIFSEAMLEERSGTYRFRDFYREDGKMAGLYEKFLLNFYKKRQSKFRVSSERIKWAATSFDDPKLELLPAMRTDISLRSEDHTIIIDAKYYSKTMQMYRENKSFHSGNLYQIYAYLKNIEGRNGPDGTATGVLLYPVVDENISKAYQIDGHEIRIETIDLALDWRQVEERLLKIVA